VELFPAAGPKWLAMIPILTHHDESRFRTHQCIDVAALAAIVRGHSLAAENPGDRIWCVLEHTRLLNPGAAKPQPDKDSRKGDKTQSFQCNSLRLLAIA
jgi:hypothetical protein